MPKLRAKISDNDGGTFRDVRMDASTGSIQVVDYEHHEIHSGSHYTVSSYQDLSINQVLQITLATPDTTKWTHITWEISTEKETLWQVYENVSVTSALANVVTPMNSNRNSLNTSGNTLRSAVHASTAAANTNVAVAGATLLAEGVSGAIQKSGENERSHELILKQNTTYSLRATATVAGLSSFSMQWYEHTSRD